MTAPPPVGPDEREAFEAWPALRWHPDANDGRLLERDPHGGYWNTAVQYAWMAWQARAARAPVEAGLSKEQRAFYEACRYMFTAAGESEDGQFAFTRTPVTIAKRLYDVMLAAEAPAARGEGEKA